MDSHQEMKRGVVSLSQTILRNQNQSIYTELSVGRAIRAALWCELLYELLQIGVQIRVA